MKANELMVGDWVYSTFCDKPCKVVGVEQYESGYANVKVTNVSGAKDINSLTPISLTPEILEKNGFEKVYDKYKLPNYRIKWKSYTDFYFTVFTGVDGYWNPIGLNVIIGGVPATVDYVHQLQNVLRLCEIEKEIEL